MKEQRLAANTHATIVQSDEELTVIAGKNAQVTVVIPMGGDSSLAQVKTTVRLVGASAQAKIVGIVAGSGDKTLSLATMQIHEAPSATSDLLVKSVLRDKVRFHYSGGIRVEVAAQKTNAYQRNENLLLSAGARAESKPALEILANDVRCTHGATVAPIDEEQLWYLQSRGITRISAEQLIVDGFLASALERIGDDAVKHEVISLVFGV